MLRLNLLLMSVAAASTAFSPTTSPAADADATAVVKKGIEFLGGEKSLKKYKAATWGDKGTYYGMGDGLPYTGKYAVQYPDKLRIEIVGIFTTVLNGSSGWVNSQGSVMAMSKKQLAGAQHGQHESYISQLYPLLDGKTYKLTADGKATVGKTAAVIVKVQSKGKRDVRFFFDPKTGALLKSEMMADPEDMSDKLVKQETYLSGYKSAGSIKYASKVLMHRAGKKYIESTITEYKPLESLPATTFAKPKS